METGFRETRKKDPIKHIPDGTVRKVDRTLYLVKHGTWYKVGAEVSNG